MSESPKKKTSKADLPTCRECGRVFDPEKQKLRSTADYNRTAEGPICKDRPSCRGRKLHAEFEKRGVKRWASLSQEQLLALMDCPPPKWDPKQKWESVNDPNERVFAAIEFYSICYPVCLLYAVQTDADGEPIKDMGEWKRHTHRSLANVLGMDQPRVTRAITHLKRRNLVGEDEGRLFPDLQPKSLFPNERDACTRISGIENKGLSNEGEEEANKRAFHALLPRTQRIIADLAPVLQADARTRIMSIALDACTRLNREISDARTRANQEVIDACTPHLTLLSRTGDSENKKRASLSPSPNRPPQNPSHEVDRQIPEPSTPVEAISTNDPDIDAMFEQIGRMQTAYPHTDFSAEKVSRDNAGDRRTIGLIVQTVHKDVMGFCVFVAAKFKGLDKNALAKLPARAPGMNQGPRSLGLILEWAKDYGRRPARTA